MRNRRRGIDPSNLGNTWWFAAFFAIMTLFWLLWLTEASAQGRMVFLEGERDLGNGMKHCIYSEGVVITIPSYKLCPLSIDI